MENVELSFCIPTYNRSLSVSRLVKDILLCADPNIEVIVLDNGSTDDTLNILSGIEDERLFVYSNGENKGALFNMINVINKGTGKFIVYSTDQDYIDYTKIDDFKSFLLRHAGDLAGGFCEFSAQSVGQNEIIPKGYQAVKKIAYQGRHPTGYFFNNKLLKSIKFVERFSDYNRVGLFPLEFAFAELCLLGDGAIYHKTIFSPETGSMVVKHKSSTTNGNFKNSFFSPEARLKSAVSYTNHVNSLRLFPKERGLLIINIFLREMMAATLGYRGILRSEDLCTHYYMESRDIKTLELLTIGLNFHKKFVSETAGVWGDGFINKSRFYILLLSRLFHKVINKLVAITMRLYNISKAKNNDEIKE